MSSKQGHRAEKKEGKASWPKILKENDRYIIRDETSAVGAYLPVVAARDGIKIYAVDRGIIPESNGQKKCDFLAITDGCEVKYFIELKGANLDAAYEEILGTIRYLKKDERYREWLARKSESRAFGLISSPDRQRVPKVARSHEIALAKSLRNLNGQDVENMFDLILYVKVLKKGNYSRKGNRIQCSPEDPMPLR
jgi:hypothetical protein